MDTPILDRLIKELTLLHSLGIGLNKMALG